MNIIKPLPRPTSSEASAIQAGPHAHSAQGAQPKAEERLDVSVVLPIHNERGHLLEEIARVRSSLEASDYSYEIVCVDDGSTDGSLELLRELDDIVLIELPTNQGCGYARRTGTKHSRGNVIVWTDVDMTYPNDKIATLVDDLTEPYDQVVGARLEEKGTHRWARTPAKRFIRWLASYLIEVKIPDLNSGFRAFRREHVRRYLHTLPNGFSCVTTITLAFLSNNHLVRYVPIEYEERAGKSKFHWRVDTYKYLLQVIRMVMMYNPLKVFMPMGGLLFLIAFAKTTFDVVTRDFYITSNSIVLIFVSLQVIAIGLLADLTSRLFRQRDSIDS